jgi:site-specific DNA-methyltransferase (adenine-specific)/site-specific DNA-methyltransferase (cytosine-N4-specific)
LKPSGTFILNIKEKVLDGQRSTYVMELIIEMKKQGWLWTEEFIWHKKNSYPGKWSNRFRDSWERLLQFNKERKFNMYQEEVMVPMGDWAKSRLKNLSDTDKIRDNSKVGRELSQQEIEKIRDLIASNINWYDAIATSIQTVVKAGEPS